MKYLLKFIPISLSLMVLYSCQQKDLLVYDIETTLIAKDNLYGNGDEGITKENLVITDEASWNDLISKMDAVNNVSDSFAETDIDFDEFQIIAVFEDLKGSGGYEIELDIGSNSDNIVVTVNEIVPTGNVTTVITQPFHIVKIPVNNLSVIFQ